MLRAGRLSIDRLSRSESKGRDQTRPQTIAESPLPASKSLTLGSLSFEGDEDSDTVADSINDVASPPPTNGTPSVESPESSKPSSPFVERSNPMGSGNAQTVSSKDPKAVAQAATDMKNVVRRKLTGYVGFANLPNQWHRKSVRKGFNFNVMVVGESVWWSQEHRLRAIERN